MLTHDSPLTFPTRAQEGRFERLRKVNRERIGEHVCAFLNDQGGILEVGVDENGHIIGVTSTPDEAKEETKQLEEFLLVHLSPRAAYSITSERVEDHFIIRIMVPPGSQGPYSFQGRIWLRSGATSHPATGEEVSALLLRPHEKMIRWERQSAPGATLDDLDLKEVERAGQDATKHHFWDGKTLTPTQILDRWGLLDYGTPTNAALVLFGRAPQRRFPQTRVRLARFASEGHEVLTTRVLEGHIFHLLRGILEFIQVHIPVVARLSNNSFQREEQTLYPFYALREAILNALVHRDYSSFDGGVSLSIYPDRLEIWSSGELLQGMSLSDLPLGGISRPRNPDIAFVLFQVGLIERLGIGGPQIVNACRNAGLPAPQWTRRGGGILLLFSNQEQKENASHLPERARKFLRSLTNGQQFSAADYHSQTSVSTRQARTDLSRLVELELLQRLGSGTHTVYQLTEKRFDE